MIAYLEGKIVERDLESIILNVGGVGYLVFATPDLIQEAQNKDEISIWTYLAVRENALDLYGFSSKKELSIFKLLLTISGIGPKSALSVLSSASIETLISGIQSNDAAYLAKMSGLGKKTAEKIVVGLKDKIGTEEFGESDGSKSTSHNVTAVDALISLGYSERDARESVAKIKDIDNPEAIIKEALKNLGK